MHWILKSIIQDEYMKNVYHRDWNKNPNCFGMLMKFSLGKNDPNVLKRVDYDRYPTRELFIWGPHNYIGVFTRDTMLHPDEASNWYILSYHDSCWREDGIAKFISYLPNTSSLCNPVFKDWYETIKPPDDCLKLIKAYPDHERHPIIK